MKTIRYFFYMILLLSNIEVLRGDYSIEPCLNYLQETEYYNLIQTIKNIFGDDVAIDICKEFVQTKDCEIVVRVYMKEEQRPTIPEPSIDAEPILQIFEEEYKTEEMRDLIVLILRFYDSLIKNMNQEEIIDFVEKIIKNKK